MNWTVSTQSGDTRQVTLTPDEVSVLADVAVMVDQTLLGMLPAGSLLPGNPSLTMDMLR